MLFFEFWDRATATNGGAEDEKGCGGGGRGERRWEGGARKGWGVKGREGRGRGSV